MSVIDYTKAYITHDNGKRLATIDENNTFIDLGAFVDDNGDVLTWPELVYGLAFGKDGEIYLTQQNGGSNEDLGGGIDTQIWKANLPAVDGKITLTKIGTGLGLHRNIAIDTHAMDIGPDGSMYILDLSGNIFTVDLTTGLASFVAETVVDGATENAKISNAMDIVFDANFTLYAEGTHPSGGSRLFRVNTSTGAATSVGTFSENMIMGLWSNSENTIYATKYSNPGNLYTVNPATAALTLVGNAGDYGNRPHGGDQWIAYGGWPGSDPPTLSSATYDASNGALVITGTNLPAYAGATNDIDISKLTLTGEGGNTYPLTSDDVELTSSTEFSITLNAADQLQLAGLFNKNGTSSGGGTTYNIAAAEDWAPGADASTDIADLTGNAITVSNVAAPTLTSASYDASTGALVITGSNLPAYPGANNDLDVSALSITGEGGNSYTLTSDDVELSSSTTATVPLNSTDQSQLASLLNKNGTSSVGGTTYNIAATNRWVPGADVNVDISDLTGNGITVANAPNTWSFSNDYLEEQTAADLDGNGVIGDGTPGNATAPANLSSATYAAGDNYLVEGTLASTAALNAVKSFFSTFNTVQGITFHATSAYKYTTLLGTATNLKTLSSTDLGNVTGTLTISDSFTAPTALSDLQAIKANFGGSTFTYYGIQGTTKELADARNDSGFDWIKSITTQNGTKSFTLTDLSLNSTHLSALTGTGSDALDASYLITQNGLTSNSTAYVGSIGGGGGFAFSSDAAPDATTSYLVPVTSSSSPYTNHVLGLANTTTPNPSSFADFNVTGDDAASGLSLTTHFYGGEQLSHISLSGADLSTTNGYSYQQTAGSGTSSVADDIWTLSLNLTPGQPAISGSVADNSGSNILGLILHTIGSSDVGSTTDLGASVFRTDAWWSDISANDPTYKFSDICPGININGSNGNAIDFDFYLSKDYLERAFSVDFDAIDGGFAGSALSSVDKDSDHNGTYIDVSKSGSISALQLPVAITDVSATTAGGSTDLYQVAFSNSSWSKGNLSLVYGPSVNDTPTPSPSPQPTPTPEPTPDPTPADTAPLATDVQLSDDDGDGLKEVITAADGALIDGNGDGIADAEQSDVVGLRMINDGAENTDYGALETDPALSFSAVSFLSPTELAANNSETYAVTTSDGQTQTTAIPSGIDNAFAGLLAFTVSGLSNGGSTSTTISLPQGLNTLDTAQLAYLRFNYATNRFEDFVDSAGTPLYSFKDSNGDGQLDSVVLQLIDGDPAWDGDGIANGSIIDPGFLATGDRKLSGNNKDNTLQGNVLANTLLGKNGSDTLIGDLGNDTLIGNGKHDRLRGGEGDDKLKGKTGDDRLNGGDHDDHLDGGKGDDILIGGSGADRFRLSKGSDTIKDFSIADDDQLKISNATNLTIEQIGSNLLLTDADKDISTTLKGVALDDLLAQQPELFG